MEKAVKAMCRLRKTSWHLKYEYSVLVSKYMQHTQYKPWLKLHMDFSQNGSKTVLGIAISESGIA